MEFCGNVSVTKFYNLGLPARLELHKKFFVNRIAARSKAIHGIFFYANRAYKNHDAQILEILRILQELY